MERNLMTDSETVKILGLGNSFTGEEELSAYRNLVKKYHPDNFETATESEKSNAHEMMIKVNAAHDYLKTKYFSNPSDMKKRVNIELSSNYNNTYNYSSEDELELKIYKQETINKINRKCTGVSSQNNYPYYIRNFLNNIEELLSITVHVIKNVCNSKGDINIQYKLFINLVNDELVKIKNKFCEINNIDIKFVNERISYNCSFQEFYEQLIKIKNTYESSNNKRDEYAKRLQSEIDKYKTYYGYEKLKDKIDTIVTNTLKNIGTDSLNDYTASVLHMHNVIIKNFANNFMDELKAESQKYKDYAGYNGFVKLEIDLLITRTLTDAMNSDFQNGDSIISKFHDDVTSIFEKSFNISNKINELKEEFEDNSEYFEIFEFKVLYDKLLKCERDFNYSTDVSNNLRDVEEELKLLKEKYSTKLELSENKELLDSYYNLVTRYNDKLNRLNPISNYEEIQKVNEIFNGVQEIIKSLMNGSIALEDVILLFDSIKFLNYDMDLKIVRRLINLRGASGIYIARPTDKFIGTAVTQFFILKELNGENILFPEGNFLVNRKVDNIILANEYISLEEVLANATRIGKNANYNDLYGERVFVLYEDTDILIYYNRFNKICVKVGKYSWIEKNDYDLSKDASEYLDKDKLIAKVKMDLESRFEYTKKAYEDNLKNKYEEYSGFKSSY